MWSWICKGLWFKMPRRQEQESRDGENGMGLGLIGPGHLKDEDLATFAFMQEAQDGNFNLEGELVK